MPRMLTVLLVLVAGCARMQWEGDRTLARDVQARPDSLLLVAAQTLREHGYDVRIVDDGTIVTAPKEVPPDARPAAGAADTLPNAWVVQVRVSPNAIRSGSRLALTAYLVPRASQHAADTTQLRSALPVSSDQPALFREVERVGNWIVAAAGSRTSP